MGWVGGEGTKVARKQRFSRKAHPKRIARPRGLTSTASPSSVMMVNSRSSVVSSLICSSMITPRSFSFLATSPFFYTQGQTLSMGRIIMSEAVGLTSK